jgi:hypothetical protein
MKIPSAPAVIPNATIFAFTIRSFLSNQVIVRLAIKLLHSILEVGPVARHMPQIMFLAAKSNNRPQWELRLSRSIC